MSGLTGKRLKEAAACLEKLEAQRARGYDPLLGKWLEQRVIWRELLELELQEIDEQLERIAAVAGHGSK